MTRRPITIRRTLLLLAAALTLRATPLYAHAVGVSRGEYRSDGSQVRATLMFARQELLATIPDLDADRDRTLTAAELERGRDRLGEWVVRGLVVRTAGTPCLGRIGDVALLEQDGVGLTVTYECQQPATAVTIRLDLLTELSLGHRHLLTAIFPTHTDHGVLYEAQPELVFAPSGPQAGARGELVPSLFRLGVEHILTSSDHLLFLLALLLLCRSLRSVLGMATAFTLAHSVTLAAAASWNCAPPLALVEPAIALSIAYVGVENCFAPDLRRRWWLAFLFGLVHGFGLADALRRIALSPAELPLGLAAFHVGVETGQFAVLALAFPLLSWIGARPWFARGGGLQVASAGISALGLFWFVVQVAS